MIAAVAIAALAVVAGAIALAAYAVQSALGRGDRAAAAEVSAANAQADARVALSAADTADRLRRAETARADALEEELAHADQDRADRPDPDARRRLLSRWRGAAELAAAQPGGDGAGPVSDPAAADRES